MLGMDHKDLHMLEKYSAVSYSPQPEMDYFWVTLTDSLNLQVSECCSANESFCICLMKFLGD